MKRAIFTALLAATAMPAQAEQYIMYEAWGPATTYNMFDGTWKNTGGFARLIVPVTPGEFDWELNPYFRYGWGSNFIEAYYQQCMFCGPDSPTIRISFDHILTGFPTTAAGFTSGSTVASDSYSYIEYGQLTNLRVRTVELDGPLLASLTVFTSVPEPASWAMMISGFALAGGAMRRRKAAVSFA